jgi:Zn-dependent protease
MRFRVFGIPTEIQFGFWFIAVLLGWNILSGPRQYLIVEWVAVVLVSILIHELGHALAMMRHGLQPEITLYTMGGVTSTPASGMGRLTRGQRLFISFAGPLAGFVFGGLIIALTMAVPALSTLPARAAGPAAWTLYEGIHDLMWVNIGWGIINLIPVLPLDGGHILEEALGPKRAKLTATISVSVGGLITLLALSWGQIWIAFVFGLCTFQSYQRFRMAAEAGPRRPQPKPVEPEVPISPEVQNNLAQARAALADDRFDQAGTLAELVLSESPPPKARVQALEVIAWAYLLEGRPDEAARAIKAIQRDGDPDVALVGAVLLAKDELDAAREVLEGARALGDDRKEVVGPLIQILIKQGEVARAAAIALDIIDTLNDEDARQMAAIAFEREAWGWSARLYEALFERTDSPDDAYDAVRCRSLEGDLSGALALLRRAVAAGFSDAARVWSDKALERLRSDEVRTELETLVPRP